MSYVPSDLKFTHSHEWVRDEGNGIYTIGITDHAQSLLGDMVFIDLPELEDELEAGDDCAVVESVKSASDIYAPLTGIVVAINEDLDGAPGLLRNNCRRWRLSEDISLVLISPWQDGLIDNVLNEILIKLT